MAKQLSTVSPIEYIKSILTDPKNDNDEAREELKEILKDIDIDVLEQVLRLKVKFSEDYRIARMNFLVAVAISGYIDILKILLDRLGEKDENENQNNNQYVYNLNYNLNYDLNMALCCTKTVEIIELLVEYGADVNSIVDKGMGTTILMAVCRSLSDNSFDIISKLLELGADPTVTDIFGTSCIFHMLSGPANINFLKKNLNIFDNLIKIFINAGVDIDNKGYLDMTILMFSCKSGLYSFVKILLDNGANPSITDNKGQKAVDMIDYIDKHVYNKELACLFEWTL